MAKSFIRFDVDDRFSNALKNAPRRVQDAIVDVIRDTGQEVFLLIKFRTPRDTGKLAAGWTKVATGPQVVISSSVPYVNVLEYGGYPVIPASRKRKNSSGTQHGNAFLGGGYPPRARTVMAADGKPAMLSGSNVSRQAPTGMVRVTLEEIRPKYIQDLEDALEKALTDGG